MVETPDLDEYHPSQLHYSASFSAQSVPPSSCCNDSMDHNGMHRSASWLPVTKIHVNGDSCSVQMDASSPDQVFGRVKSRLSTKSLRSLSDQNDGAGIKVVKVRDEVSEENHLTHPVFYFNVSLNMNILFKPIKIVSTSSLNLILVKDPQ
jgi:hypothetical protein